jgi:hypothetical protein
MASSSTVALDDSMFEPSNEDKYVVLRQWWEKHCKSFTEWYLNLDAAKKEETLLKASPDMPKDTAGTREASGETLKASDVLLPELNLQALTAEGGKLLALFFTRRCVSQDLCFHADVMFLNGLLKSNNLPLFSNGALKDMDTVSQNR